MLKERIGGLPVIEDRELVGLIEKRCFLERLG
jgi:CBS domain-containing protein